MDFIVTSSENPDLDGVACSYAYAEFLKKKGVGADYAVFGRPLPEVEYAAKIAGLKIKKSTKLKGNEKFILVDTSIVSKISRKIRPNEVVEIIDHRKMNTSKAFVNAKIQIEFVGAAATLVVEKFIKGKIQMSNEARTLLFYAILSNTINFRNSVTTERDKRAAAYLKHGLTLKKDFVTEFFKEKSKIADIGKSIKDYMGVYEFPGARTCIAQWEIMSARKLVERNRVQIASILSKLGKKNSALSLLTAIDIWNEENIFFTEDEELRKALEDLLKVKFVKSVARRKGIIMRKELAPLLDSYFRHK